MATGIVEAKLKLSNVDKDDSGNYTCVAESHEKAKNETEIELIVNYPPKGTRLKFDFDNETSVTIICEADALPPPKYEIYFNGTTRLRGKKTYKIDKVTSNFVGKYTCVAWNLLGRSFSSSRFLPVQKPNAITTAPTTSLTESRTRNRYQPTVSTTSNETKPALTTTPTDDGTGKISEECNGKTEWYIVVVSLVSGIIIGITFSYIVSCQRRKFRNSKSQQSKPKPPKSQVDSTYQELDLIKMNREDNYQSLRVNAARNDGVDDESNYAELNKTREVENNYQSLT
ncbi:interference hedgehog-like [Dendronephthya gigantea]|uniref:interference hedgehog-like n=1 Tax=Dendronephthya gigantea TaxID=151771 RepID=UPI00106A1A35|nr:interference hedgehog-like [Dendronephthya gigantea]